MSFQPGDRVIKSPATWQPNAFDSWGRGIGIGVVVEPPFPVGDLQQVDVRWPNGSCFEPIAGLLPASRKGVSRKGVISRKGVRNRLRTVWSVHDKLMTLWDDQNVLRMVV